MEGVYVSGKDSNVFGTETSVSSFNKKSFVNHLAELPSNDDVILDVYGCRNVIEEESIMHQKVNDISEIEIDGFLYRRKPSHQKIEVEAKSWEIVIENIRRLERENDDLNNEVKSQKEKRVNETAEKVSLLRQLKQNRKEIAEFNQRMPQSTERKVLVEHVVCKSDKANSNSLDQNLEIGGTSMFDCFSGFHGFCEEETVMTISSSRKMLLDKLIADEETLIETLDDRLDELWKRNVLGKSIHEDELDTSREWSEEARSLLEDV